MATHCQITYGNELGEGSVQQLMTQLHALQLTQLLGIFFFLQKILFSATGTHRQIRTFTAQLVTNYSGDCEPVTYPATPDLTLLHRPAGILARLFTVSFFVLQITACFKFLGFWLSISYSSWPPLSLWISPGGCFPLPPSPSLQSHPVLQNWRTESSSSLDEMPTTTQTAQFACLRAQNYTACVCNVVIGKAEPTR